MVQALQPEDRAAAGEPARAAAPSVLTADVCVVGELASRGWVRIDGLVEGDVRAQGVIVGEAGTVRGDVMAEEVEVRGAVTGRISGFAVRLEATARVTGDILQRSLAIAFGAEVEGSVRRLDSLAPVAVPGRVA